MRALAIALAGLGCALVPARASDGDGLAAAIRANDVAALQAALAAHADVNARLEFGATPLALAVNAQNPALVSALLAKGANPSLADADGVTPLGLACELGGAEIVARLLDAHADLRTAAPDGTTPLHLCARYGPSEAVVRMLAAGMKPDRADTRGQTPLMWAAAAGRTEAMAALLKAGADVNRVTAGGFTPLFFAIKSGVAPATTMLLDAGADTAHRGPEHSSALQVALYQHNLGAAALLAARGADLAERDRNGDQPLHLAAAAGDVALVRLLLQKGADPNALTGPSRITWVTEANFGRAPPAVPPTPPLLVAAQNGRAQAMQLLLAAGANPRFVAGDGTNIVLAAAKGGSDAALALALTLAPDANVADAGGATALHLLVSGGMHPAFVAMLQTLARHGARWDIPNAAGYTAGAVAVNGLTEVKLAFLSVFPEAAAATLPTSREAPPKPPVSEDAPISGAARSTPTN